MARINSLYNGFVKGRSTAIKFGPNNPKIDTTISGAYSQKVLGVHATHVQKHAKVDGPTRKVSGLPGRRVNGSTRISGGQM